MGKAIKKKMGIDPNEKKKHTSKRLKNGNRRERKLKEKREEKRKKVKSSEKGTETVDCKDQ